METGYLGDKVVKVIKVFQSLKSPLRFAMKNSFAKRVFYGLKSMFYKGKIPLFSEKCIFDFFGHYLSAYLLYNVYRAEGDFCLVLCRI